MMDSNHRPARLRTSHNQIAEFSPAGLNLDRIKQARGLTSKKLGQVS